MIRLPSSFLIPTLIFVCAFLVLGSIVGSQPFGHDESVYLTKARSLISGTPADEFMIYRPIGMAAFGWVFLNFNDSEIFVRFFGVFFGAMSLVFLYLLFKRLFNIYVALFTVITTGTSTLFLQQAPLFQNDIASSGLLFGVLWILYAYYESAGKSRAIYFIGLLAALAFYIRYGVVTALAIVGVLTLLFLAPRFIKKENVDYSKLSVSLIISILLFVPHFIESFIAEGKLLGILTRSGAAAGREYLGEGLISYIKWLPSELGGWIFGIVAMTGIFATVIFLFKKDLRESFPNLLWIGSIGILNFLVTGILVHPEARYIFFPVALLVGVGIASLDYLIRGWSRFATNSSYIIFLVILLTYGATNYLMADSFFRARESDPYAVAYAEVARIIHSDSGNSSGCVVWTIPTNRPRVSWYSQCSTPKIGDAALFEKDFDTYLRKNHYSLVRASLPESQINKDSEEKYKIQLTEIYRTTNLSKLYGGDLIVYRISRKNTEEEDYLKLLEI